MLLRRVSPTPSSDVVEARSTTRPRPRTFALACRLLPRDLRDDVYLLYLVFRTLDDLVDDGEPEATAAVAAVEGWCDGRHASVRARRASSPTSTTRHALPRSGAARFLRGDARRPRRSACGHRGRARRLLLPRRRDRRRRHDRAARLDVRRGRRRTRPRSGWPCSGRTSCATSTRILPQGAATCPRRRSRGSGRPPTRAPGSAAARPDRPRGRALRRGPCRRAAAALRPARNRRCGRDVPRDPAADRTGRLRRHGRSCRRAHLAQAADRGALRITARVARRADRPADCTVDLISVPGRA